MMKVMNMFRTFVEKRRRKRYAREIREEYPDFLDEILLYMNAGLIFENAMEEIDSAHGGSDPFYEEIHGIISARKQSNQDIDIGFHRWARTCGIPEIMRFSSICHDVIHKGVDASEKIEMEAILSRQEKMRIVEEKGRTAETKLAFPMTLMLVALMILTLAPVFMEMRT